jgi:hypothetical protein
MINGAWVYILLCADGSYYVGSTTDDPDVAPASTMKVSMVATPRCAVR